MRFRSPGLQTTNKTHLTSALLPAYNAFHIQEDEWERPANEWNSMDLFHKRHFIERVGWNHWQWSCPKCKCMNDINELLSHLIFKITHCLRKHRHLSTSMLFFIFFFFHFLWWATLTLNINEKLENTTEYITLKAGKSENCFTIYLLPSFAISPKLGSTAASTYIVYPLFLQTTLN